MKAGKVPPANSSIQKHNEEIQKNLLAWERKPLLQRIYREFYKKIRKRMVFLTQGLNVELGSGIGNLKSVVPEAISTDLFPNPWIDQVENAYQLSFEDSSVKNLVLFDVFHHLEYPGTALKEFYRVLKPDGKVIIFEPAVSALGLIVYGLLHHEPLGLSEAIQWVAPPGWIASDSKYYAAQGNACRIFRGSSFDDKLTEWEVTEFKQMATVAYVASGGFSKPQLYPTCLYPFIKALDRILDFLPLFFATRLLITLTKKELAPKQV